MFGSEEMEFANILDIGICEAPIIAFFGTKEIVSASGQTLMLHEI